jgi:hypothetical protein
MGSDQPQDSQQLPKDITQANELETFNEQAFLTDNLDLFASHHAPPQKGGYKRFLFMPNKFEHHSQYVSLLDSGVMDGDKIRNFSLMEKLPKELLSSLNPKLKIYKIKPRHEQDNNPPRLLLPFNNFGDPRTLQQTSPLPGDPYANAMAGHLAVGLKNFTFDFLGTNPAEVDYFINCKLRLYFSSTDAFFHEYTEGDHKVAFSDLILRPKKMVKLTGEDALADREFNDAYFRILVEVGYDLPDKEFLRQATKAIPGSSPEYIFNAIKAQRLSMFLTLKQHQIFFKPEIPGGPFEIEFEFNGSQEALAADPYRTNLIRVGHIEEEFATSVRAGLLDSLGVNIGSAEVEKGKLDAKTLGIIERHPKEFAALFNTNIGSVTQGATLIASAYADLFNEGPGQNFGTSAHVAIDNREAMETGAVETYSLGILGAQYSPGRLTDKAIGIYRYWLALNFMELYRKENSMTKERVLASAQGHLLRSLGTGHYNNDTPRVNSIFLPKQLLETYVFSTQVGTSYTKKERTVVKNQERASNGGKTPDAQTQKDYEAAQTARTKRVSKARTAASDIRDAITAQFNSPTPAEVDRVTSDREELTKHFKNLEDEQASRTESQNKGETPKKINRDDILTGPLKLNPKIDTIDWESPFDHGPSGATLRWVHFGDLIEDALNIFTDVDGRILIGDERRSNSHEGHIGSVSLEEARTFKTAIHILSNFEWTAYLSDGKTHVVSLASFPIAYSSFADFWVRKVLDPMKETYSFKAFLKDALIDLVIKPLNDYSGRATGPTGEKISKAYRPFVQYQDITKNQPIGVKATPRTIMASPTVGNQGMVTTLAAAHASTSTGSPVRYAVSLGRDASLDNNRTAPATNDEDLTSFLDAPALGIDQNLCIVAVETSDPSFLKNHKALDTSKGVIYVELGREGVPIKNIQLNRANQPFLMEARAEKGLLGNSTQLSEVYNCNFTTIGNIAFKAGKYFYLRMPWGMGDVNKDIQNFRRRIANAGHDIDALGSLADEQQGAISRARLMGLGGYYFVTKTRHQLAVNAANKPEWVSTVESFWNSFGSAFGPASQKELEKSIEDRIEIVGTLERAEESAQTGVGPQQSSAENDLYRQVDPEDLSVFNDRTIGFDYEKPDAGTDEGGPIS